MRYFLKTPKSKIIKKLNYVRFTPFDAPPSSILEGGDENGAITFESCAESETNHEVRISLGDENVVMHIDVLKDFIRQTEQEIVYLPDFDDCDPEH